MRYEIHGDLLATLDSSQVLRIANIGVGGALIWAPAPLPLQSVHNARLVVAAEESDVRVGVRHVRPLDGRGGYMIGVEFLELAPAALFKIEMMLAESGEGEVEGA